MMKFLVEHDKYECVGAYFRNARMAEYEEVPDTYLDDYHNRNKDEGFNGKLKNVLNIEIFVQKGNMVIRWICTRLCP